MDEFTARALLLFVMVFVSLFVLTACGTVGNGRSTLVLAKKPSGNNYSGDEFAALLTDSDKTQLRAMGAGDQLSQGLWASTVKKRFGGDTTNGVTQPPHVASVSLTVRDRTRTPIFTSFNLDVAQLDEILALLLNNKISNQEKQKLIASARNNYVTLSEVPERVVFDRYVPASAQENAGAPEWRYFIELEVNLTGTLESPDPLTRFSYLAAVLRIPNGIEARFINFEPKVADLYEIAIGHLKTAGSASANAKKGASANQDLTTVDKSQTDIETTSKMSAGATSETGFSLQLNEELTREIKAGLDIRSAGIHQDGKVFLIELRGTDLQRIAGTYTYNVMLEIRSRPRLSEDGTVYFGEPLERALSLETRSVAVVRHVVKRGRTGYLTRVPEPLNDHAFHQVIVADGKAEAWRFRETPRGDRVVTESEPDNLIVRSPYNDATFVIRARGNNGRVIAYGTGTQATYRLDPGTHLTVEFLPIVRTDEAIVELIADSEDVTIPADGASTVVAHYKIGKAIKR